MLDMAILLLVPLTFCLLPAGELCDPTPHRMNILLAAFTRQTPRLVMLAWKYPAEQTTVRLESGVLLQTKPHSSHRA